MGFPSKGLESTYRNPLTEVKRFLDKRHKGYNKIYNLCIESNRQHSPNSFDRVACYGFFDHNPPPLKMIEDFCNDVVCCENNQGRLSQRKQSERSGYSLQGGERKNRNYDMLLPDSLVMIGLSIGGT